MCKMLQLMVTGALFCAVSLKFTVNAAIPAGQIIADPNVIGLGAQFHGTMNVKAGDRFSIGWFDVGGFIEARNEPGFNQGLLPNHNWRGFVSGAFNYPVIREMQIGLSLFTGIEHESSHATMGIAESPRSAYRMIYDHWYRKSQLNGVPLGAQLVMYDELQRLIVRAGGVWCFLSKNTPELPGLDVSGSGGLSAGFEYGYLFGKRLGAFFSLFDRYIFRGPAERTGAIYTTGGADGPVLQTMRYPIISSSNTFSMAGGISFPLFQSRRVMKLYLHYLHGNPYGFVDSRDGRNLFGGGFSITGM